MIEQVEQLIGDALIDAVARDSIEIVRDFALPIQSRALAILLNVPPTEAEIWIRWGIHVFRDPKTGVKGSQLDSYIQEQLDRAEKEPGEDFFRALTQATFLGRSLKRDEMEGFANLTFAGGRDTVINTITAIVAYFSSHIQKLDSIRKEPKLIPTAAEEFARLITPLTHIGRKCPEDTEVEGYNVAANERISLCWASANFDETVFDSPEEVRLDRRPNPHIAYGAGTHMCLGAPHARLIIRSLLKKLSEHIGSIELIDFDENVEREAQYQRKVGYQSLVVRLTSRATSH
jgi:cytochrome P450